MTSNKFCIHYTKPSITELEIRYATDAAAIPCLGIEPTASTNDHAQENDMPEISRFLGIIIAMYYNEHNPPHFHARYGDAKVEIAIDTLSVLAGKLPPRAMGLVIEWASRHQDELKVDWQLARQQSALNSIEPLE